MFDICFDDVLRMCWECFTSRLVMFSMVYVCFLMSSEIFLPIVGHESHFVMVARIKIRCLRSIKRRLFENVLSYPA